MRPLYPALAALVLGAFGVVFGAVPAGMGPGFLLGGAVLALLLGMAFLLRGKSAVPLFLMAVFCLGVAQTQRSLVPGPSDVSRWADGPSFWVRGTVVSNVEMRPHDSCSFVLRADAVNDYQAGWPVTGQVSVFAPAPDEGGAELLQPGQTLWLRGKLQSPSGQTNPDGFDEARFLARRGIRAVLSVRRQSDIRAAKNDEAQTVGPLQRAALWVRTGAEKIINAHLPASEAGLLNGLLLSNRSHLNPDMREDFVRTGTVHILSVSGLHIAALAWVVQTLLFRLGLRRKPVAVVTICFLAFAALAAGGSVASVRSVVCASVVLAAPLLKRTNVDSVHPLLVAAFGLVLLDPLVLFDAGAQLSFATVGALLLIMPLVSRAWFPQDKTQSRLIRARRFVLQALVVGFVAEAASGPLTAYHFNRVSLVGPIANLCIVPLAEGLVAGGMVTVCASSVLPDFLTGPLWGLLHLGLVALQNLAHFWGSLPRVSPSIKSPPVAALWVYYLLLGGAAVYARRVGKKTFFAPSLDTEDGAGRTLPDDEFVRVRAA